MKNNLLILTLAVLSLMATGCAKESKTEVAQTGLAAPVVNPTFPVDAPPGEGANSKGNNWAYGATVDFVPDNLTIFNTYVGARPLNNPTNVKLNVNLVDVGGSHFAGAIKIAYDDAGKRYEGYFFAGPGVNSNSDPFYGTAKDVGLLYTEYNTWFNGGKNFSGFFQDSLGAVVLVIDNVVNQGDGQGTSLVSGSIWFKNFQKEFPAQANQRYCWFMYIGPYVCRSQTVMDKTSPYPSDGYRRLGTFSQLSRAKAFNQ